MRHWLLAGAILAASVPLPAAAAIRAVFVGINTYRYSAARVTNAGFRDLRGAVGDVGRIKDALRTAYGLDLDSGGCQGNAVSITLTDNCATRAAILAALDDRIAASGRGDTLIFYFAGHGSRFVDDQEFDQASGYNGTIMPTDAREPGAAAGADILDREIREVIDRATAKGINVVTMFDSCNSGTAARDGVGEGESRSAPPLKVHGPGRVPALAPRGPGGGYRVHLAAAADDEEAREIGTGGTRAGVFTSALAATLVAMPNAAFADIAAEVRLKVEESGHSAQNPQAEGALRASMGAAARDAVLLQARSEAGAVTLLGGQLSGITEGSEFALFATTTAALDAAATPLARGRVARVDATSATLALDAPPALPARLIARETAHAFGKQIVNVRIEASGPARAAIERALAALAFVRVAEPAQLAVVSDPRSSALVSVDGSGIATLTEPDDPRFAAAVHAGLQKVARVQALLALRTDPTRAEASFCIDGSDYDPFACPGLPAAGRVLALGQPARIAVVNTGSAPRYLYVFGIDAEYSVTLLLPANGGRDPAVNPRQPVQRRIAPNSPGRYRFVTIATDAPIDAAALEQQGARDPGACRSALERALCAATAGTRDPSAPRVGAWTATVATALVE